MDFEAMQASILARQTILPKRLVEPGPSAAQLAALMDLAASAPDHGRLTPWRFILVRADQRHRLADAFAQALIDRDPQATSEQMAAAREKAHRAPLLLIAIARLGADRSEIPDLERMISMGAAIQNILLGAQAMGFGASLTSGQAMSSPRLRELCGLTSGEEAVCCVNVGTVGKRKDPDRTRPTAQQVLSVLT